MSQQAKWDRRYVDGSGKSSNEAGRPAYVLKANLDLLPDASAYGLSSLDVACGLAANGLLLAEKGFNSFCWDISAVAINKVCQQAEKRGLALQAEVRDIERQPPVPDSFDVIVVSRFLHRPLCKDLAAALKPGGVLFYQTFSLLADGSVPQGGPQNPEYRLAKGELPALFPTLKVLRYQEAETKPGTTTGMRHESYLIAQATSKTARLEN